jgi:signal transduction histidine kinase
MDKAAARIEAFADPDAVEQVVANLLENAVKHTPAGTPIHVRVTEESGYAVLVVRDEGPGVPVEERATLFEPFRRGREEKGSGVGLGLFIVANLVRSMGGTVEVSGEQGEGAVFTVRLPSEPPSQAPDALERAGGERQ